MQHHVLQPGEYFVEMAFERPVDPGILHRALTNMGFQNIVFDQSSPKVDVGAIAVSRPTSSLTAAKAAIAAPVTQSIAAPVRAPIAPLVQTAPPPPPAPVVRAPLTSSVMDPSAPRASLQAMQAAMTPAPSNIVVRPPLTSSTTATPSRTIAQIREAMRPETPRIPRPGGMLPGGGGGGGGSAAPSMQPMMPEAEQAAADGGGGGEGGGGGGGGGPSPEGEASASPDQASSEAPAQLDPVEVAKDLWRRWREWGSPFADGPGQVRVSGEPSGTRVRFVAALTRPISLNDAPGMRWLFVKRLAFSAFSDLSYKVIPHPLSAGRTYEFRFLSRAKSTPTREAVAKGLAVMGFLPMKLIALKRNMRLPGRPGASLTLWYGIGQWNKADSVIIADDPFAFENLAELPPV